MSYQGDTNNPIPSGIDSTKINPYTKNTGNRALDIKRSTDTRKDFTVTLLDIDTTLLEYLQNVINLSVVDSGQTIKVPIIYGSPERWKAVQNDGYLRDQQGKIQLPVVMFKRNAFSKNENLMTLNRYLTYPIISKFSEKNKYEKFNLFSNNVAPVHQIHAVTLPDHIKVEYEFIIWTEYVEQMNSIIEKINFAAEDYWGDPQRLRFRVSINDYSNTVEVSNSEDRSVKTNFTLSVFAYLLPESMEERKSTVQKTLTPKKISITAETVSDATMKTIVDKNKKSSSTNYYKLGNVMSHDSDSWILANPAVSKEISEGSISTEQIQQIRQTFAALIQQTVTYTIDASTSLWHDAPTSPSSPGQEGWMAFDGDYHYIYAGGRWLRHAIDEWS